MDYITLLCREGVQLFIDDTMDLSSRSSYIHLKIPLSILVIQLVPTETYKYLIHLYKPINTYYTNINLQLVIIIVEPLWHPLVYSNNESSKTKNLSMPNIGSLLLYMLFFTIKNVRPIWIWPVHVLVKYNNRLCYFLPHTP